jgi:hypothetical protein
MKYEVVRQGCLLRTTEWLKRASFCLLALLLVPVQAGAPGGKGNDSPPPPPKKVTVCHKGHAIEISENALSAHLAHGDTEGPCEVTPSKNK